ncbi:MAG: hypothetical protein HC904_05750 [Blastochloris sp.]|nr:hypothetical protein [Blastochloris sp.]
MNKDKILSKEIAKLGGFGGLGGGIGGAMGGALASYIASVFLPTETESLEITLPFRAEDALQLSASALTKIGTLFSPCDPGPTPVLYAKVGSGFLNMNPCVVSIEVIFASEHETKLHISGAAKEGLIKQQSAKKAVNRVYKKIMNSVSTSCL